MISAIVGIFIVTIISILFIFMRLKNRKLPPGPIVWPVIGNVIEIRTANVEYPHLALSKLAEKYGKIMGIGFGSTYSVVISGYQEVKDIWKKSETCEARYEFPFVRDRSFNKKLGIIWSSGEQWRNMRRFTIKTLRDFGFGKKQSMELLIKEETDAVVADIRRLTEKEGIWAVDPHYLSITVLNILWTMVGGDRFQYDDEKITENLRLNALFAKIVGHNNIYNAFPFLKRWFPKLVHHDEHMKVHTGIQQWIQALVEEAKVNRSARGNTNAQSFIEVFLDEIEKSKNMQTDFTEEQLVVILLDLFFAGGETTSMTLNWAILFLTLNPDVQRKLQLEIKQAVLTSPNMSTTEAGKLPYLKAVLLEVSRLGVVAPVPLPRLATEDIQYNNLLIPKGTCLYANLHPIFQDKALWGDPEVFRPERFLNNEGEVISELEQKIAIFGFGTRKCLGEPMVWDSLRFFLIELLQNFTFEPIQGQEPSAENPHSAVTIRPRLYSVRVVPN